MIDYKTDDLIDSIYNVNWNQDSLPDVILDDIEVEFLKGLASGKSLKKINLIIKIYSKTETFGTVALGILEKLEAFTLSHAVSKIIKMRIVEF